MVISVTSAPSKPVVVDHILCPFTPVIKAIFLREDDKYSYEIYFKGKKIAKQDVSKQLISELTDKGFTFIMVPNKRLTARSHVFGINIGVQKNCQGKQIKELVISVPAASHTEMLEKRKIIISGINAIAPGIQLKVTTSDKFVRC